MNAREKNRSINQGKERKIKKEIDIKIKINKKIGINRLIVKSSNIKNMKKKDNCRKKRIIKISTKNTTLITKNQNS
jgi:hypothetical protein